MSTFNKCLLAVCLYAFCAAACSKGDDQGSTQPPVPVPPVITFTSIASFVPATATAGDPVKITGTKFTGATSVIIGNVAAQSFQVISDTVIMAYVANAGASSGKVSVVVPSATADATGFVYYTPQQSTLAGSISYATLAITTVMPPFDSSKMKTFVVPETVSLAVRNINPNDNERNLTAFFANGKAPIRSRYVDSPNFVILTGVVAQNPKTINGFGGESYSFSATAPAMSSIFARVTGETITIPYQTPSNGYVYITGTGVLKNGVVVSLDFVIDDNHGNSKRGSLIKL
jgi:hypothetical protein